MHAKANITQIVKLSTAISMVVRIEIKIVILVIGAQVIKSIKKL